MDGQQSTLCNSKAAAATAASSSDANVCHLMAKVDAVRCGTVARIDRVSLLEQIPFSTHHVCHVRHHSVAANNLLHSQPLSCSKFILHLNRHTQSWFSYASWVKQGSRVNERRRNGWLCTQKVAIVVHPSPDASQADRKQSDWFVFELIICLFSPFLFAPEAANIAPQQR